MTNKINAKVNKTVNNISFHLLKYEKWELCFRYTVVFVADFKGLDQVVAYQLLCVMLAYIYGVEKIVTLRDAPSSF